MFKKFFRFFLFFLNFNLSFNFSKNSFSILVDIISNKTFLIYLSLFFPTNFILKKFSSQDNKHEKNYYQNKLDLIISMVNDINNLNTRGLSEIKTELIDSLNHLNMNTTIFFGTLSIKFDSALLFKKLKVLILIAILNLIPTYFIKNKLLN